MFKGDQICFSRVASEISEGTLLSSDNVLTFLCPPWDRNMTWFGGQLRNILFRSSQHGVDELIHHTVYHGEINILNFGMV
jgi:hypothetical protein